MDQQKAAEAARIALVHIAHRVLDTQSLSQIPGWIIHSKPYLKAIRNGDYGLEDPKMCVLYALNNLHNWRGNVARKVKTMLKESIE